MQAATLIRTRSGPLPSPIAGIEHEVHRALVCRSPISPVAARSVHLELKPAFSSLRRARSEASLAVTGVYASSHRPKPPQKTAEEDEEEAEAFLKRGSLDSSPILSLGVAAATGAAEVLLDELEFSAGGGSGGGRKVGGRGRGCGGGGGDPRSAMGAYYKEMLRTDPENPLLLLNYGKFLQEVEGDLAGAEDCYGRAILANPSDGEALSLYGNLMWEAHRDEERAEGFFQRAVEASPEDCYVLGSYAHFLWDAEEETEKSSNPNSSAAAANPFMVEAY